MFGSSIVLLLDSEQNRTDTHWNALGGWLAMEGFLAFLREQGIGVKSAIPGLAIEPGPIFEGGDLIGMEGLYWTSFRPGDNFTVSGLPKRVQWNDHKTRTNPDAANTQRLWLFHDSFFVYAHCFFDELFPVIVPFHHRGVIDRVTKALSSPGQPEADIIVLQLAERML